LEEFEIIRALAGFASAFGTIALYKFNLAQSQKARAELIEKFEDALKREQKHSVCELFRMLHSLNLDYDDIVEICNHRKVGKIILALKKTPGIVKYEEGALKYTSLFEKDWVRKSNKLVTRGIAYFMGLLTILLIITMAFMKGPVSIVMLVFVIPAVALLTMQIKDLRHDKMIESIVKEEN